MDKTIKWATEGLPFDDVTAGVGAQAEWHRRRETQPMNRTLMLCLYMRYIVVFVAIDDDYIRLIEYDRRSPEWRLPCFRVMFVFWAALSTILDNSDFGR